MKITTKPRQISIWDLFCHDLSNTGPLDEAAVANWITEQLQSRAPLLEVEHVVVKPPEESGLSRFVVEITNWDKGWSMLPGGRPYTPQECRELMPPWLVAALREIDAMEVEL